MALAEKVSRRIESQVPTSLDARLNVPQHWDSFMAKDALKSYDKSLSTPDFLAHVNNITVETIASPDYHDETGQISDVAWKRLVDGGILAASLDERDHEKRQEEIMQTLRILSYHDINLGLTFGITTALAIMPFQKFYSSLEQREEHLDIIRRGERVGLAITEINGSGTAAMDMESNYKKNEDGTITLNFKKQFQGLSGNAGLIVAARENIGSGDDEKLTSTIGLFFVGKEDISTTPTRMIGLHGISYALNEGTVTLDKKHMMVEIPRNRLSKDFQGLFTNSRMFFSGMPLGHQERSEYEALKYANERRIGGKQQVDMEVPQDVLREIKAGRIVAEAIFNRIIKYRTEDGKSLLHGDTSELDIEASMAKVLSTELALRASLLRAKLGGGKSYYEDRSEGGALRAFVNIWPFSIFEGTEDFLYWQIGHGVLKRVSRGIPGISLVEGSSMEFDEEAEGFFEKIGARIKTGNTNSINKVHEKVLGEIFSRKFAMGCIELDDICEEDEQNAKDMLNLEVKQQALEFLSIKSKSVEPEAASG